MESLPVQNSPSVRNSLPTASTTGTHAPARTYPTPQLVTPERRRNSPTRTRFNLQQRAAVNLRRHVERAAVRFLVLVVADLAAFHVTRALVRVVRDRAILGDWLAGHVGSVLPAGILNGWQFAAALFAALLVTGNYGTGDLRRSPKRLFLGAALATALPLWMTIWTRGIDIVSVQYVVVTALVWLGLVAERHALDRVVGPVLRRMNHAARAVFVGPAEECRGAAVGPAFADGREYVPLGFIDTHIPPAPDALGHIVEFERLLHETAAETVVICGYLPDTRFRDIVDAGLAARCHVLSVPRAIDIAGVEPILTWKRGQAVIELARPVVAAPALFLKRVTDLLAASVGLIILSPVFLSIAALIKLDSPGPVFFASRRWGQGGKRIRIWKFRTMVNGALDLLNSNPDLRAEYEKGVKLRQDPRVTRVGKWLRRLSLDELPQMFNVLMGDMSLVGPRPKLFGEEQRYGPLLPVVLAVPPGMTGLWQVSGRNSLTYDERVALDVDYVRRCSVLLDLKILLQTVPVVVRGVGAH